MRRIEEIRKWIGVCDGSGIGGNIPVEIRELDAYSTLLEAEIFALRKREEAFMYGESEIAKSFESRAESAELHVKDLQTKHRNDEMIIAEIQGRAMKAEAQVASLRNKLEGLVETSVAGKDGYFKAKDNALAALKENDRGQI